MNIYDVGGDLQWNNTHINFFAGISDATPQLKWTHAHTPR